MIQERNRTTAPGFGEAPFELTGGNIALDLANTLDRRASDQPEERLNDYRDLLRFAEQTKLVTRPRAAALQREAASHPVTASRALRRAVELRELIFRIFSTREAQPSALADLTNWSRQAAAHRRLVKEGPAVAWKWETEDLDSMLWPIVEEAVSLATSSLLPRVRTCSGATCRWLFIDHSRQGNRRWCDMKICGNRAKARRHYMKGKAQGE